MNSSARPATSEELDFLSVQKNSQFRETFLRLCQNKAAVAGMIFLVFLILLAVFADLLFDYQTTCVDLNIAERLQWPSAEHWFGTDNIGRDMWARTWYGTRTSLLLGFVIAFFDVTLGTIAGALWGYVQRIDRFMTELYNIVTNIPQTVYLVLFTYILRPSFWTIVLAMCLTGWLSIARFVRNRVVAVRENEYNIASQCLGTPLSRILLKNIVPYIVSIVIMEVALTIPYSIGSEVFLSYINLGLPLDVVSLGNLVSVGKNSFEVYPFQLIYPTIILSFVTVSFYIVGNRFADASDPRNHI